jgi:hypothetical protein
MDKTEAKQILLTELEPFKAKPYRELIGMVGAVPITSERIGPSGREYQVEIQAIWDDKPLGKIRILGSVDDGGWRAFCPLTEDFIISPQDKLVGK